MTGQVRDRRSHERDIRKQHELLVDVWPATIANCRNGENDERQQCGKLQTEQWARPVPFGRREGRRVDRHSNRTLAGSWQSSW